MFLLFYLLLVFIFIPQNLLDAIIFLSELLKEEMGAGNSHAGPSYKYCR